MPVDDDRTLAIVGRRTVLKTGMGLGVGLSLRARLAVGQGNPPLIRPKEGDLLVTLGDSSLKPLTPTDIPVNATPVMTWAMDPTDHTVRSGSRLNSILLVRLDPAQLSPETLSRAADGVVAYTAICTHTGCEVEQWLAVEQLLYCTCHSSKFDPKDGAKVVEGPAPRALPALPLKLVDGKLVVASSFTARVGFESA